MKKMKANFIIGKKQIILAALVLVLGGAVYVNYLYANNDGSYLATNTVTKSTKKDAGKNYGDAQLVSGDVKQSSDYFQQAALEKTKNRDEAIESVKSVIEKGDANAEELAAASAKIVEISQQIEAEGTIEGLIKAKGFTDCIVYLDNESANVVVQTKELNAEQAAQIKNIVLSQKDIKNENITIQEVNK